MQTHTTAIETAEYLVWLAAHECLEDPDFLTPLKLQKLLYYVQGWSLAETGHPFFSDRIEAWQHGPVVPSVYAKYKGQEKSPIVPDQEQPIPTLSDQEKSHIRSVWDVYKRHSGWALREMTHVESPYVEAYSPSDASGRCNRTIEISKIKSAFENRMLQTRDRLASKRSRLRGIAQENTRKIVGRDSL